MHYLTNQIITTHIHKQLKKILLLSHLPINFDPPKINKISHFHVLSHQLDNTKQLRAKLNKLLFESNFKPSKPLLENPNCRQRKICKIEQLGFRLVCSTGELRYESWFLGG